MSEYDANRFINENTNDRRSSPVITPGLRKISQSIFGKNSSAPVSAEVREPEEQEYSDMHEDDYDVVINAQTDSMDVPRNESSKETCQVCDGAGDGYDGTCWNCNGHGVVEH